VSVDVDRGIMLVNWMRVPSRVELLTREQAAAQGMRMFDGRSGQGGGAHPQENTPYAARPGAFVSPLGIPCAAPPWGLLSAVDLASGRVIWSRPLGNGRDSGPWGLRSHLPVTMGVPLSGGSLATRTGLVFVGLGLDLLQARRHGLHQSLTCFGRRNRARGSTQQANAQSGFQRSNRVTQRRLRYPKLRRRSREAAFARHREECQ
jgi:hypothetical protein